MTADDQAIPDEQVGSEAIAAERGDTSSASDAPEATPEAGEEAMEYNVPVVVGSLILGVFFGGAGAGVAFPTLPTLGTILGISPFVVGLILSINRFTRLLMNTPAGQIIDRVGTRKPMILGFVLQGIPPFGYVLGLHPELVPVLDAGSIFLVARAVWGFGSAMVFVGAFSIIVHITSEENRGRWIGYFRGGQSVGVPAGLVLGGLLTDIYGYEVAFVTAGSLSLLAAVLASFVIPNLITAVDNSARLRDVPGVVRSDPRFLAIGLVNFVVRFLFIGVLAATIVIYAQRHGVRIGSFSAVGVSGVILAIGFVFSSLTTLVSGRLSDWVDSRALITLPPLGLFAFGFVLLAAVPKLEAIVVAIACIGVGVGGTNPPMMAFLGDISPAADMGKMGGVYNVFGDLGGTLGPIVALPVAVRIGYRTEYLLCAVLVVLVSVVVVQVLVDLSPEESRGSVEGG